MVFSYDLAAQATQLSYTSASFDTPKAHKLLEIVRRGGGQEDHPGYVRLGQARTGRVLGERDFFAIADDLPIPTNDWRDSVLDVTGATARSGLKINDIGPFLDCVITHDTHTGGHGAPELIEISGWLTPLMTKTLEANRVYTALSQGFDRLLTLFDRLDFGAVFCTAEGTVLTANRAFAEISGGRDGIVNNNGNLLVAHAESANTLRQILQASMQPGSQSRELAATISRPSGNLPFIVRAAPIRLTDVNRDTVTLLLVIDPENSDRVSARGLATLGGLTPAELDVCDLLVKGLSTEDIAAKRDTSTETARTQIKAAASKLACQSRLDLLRLALVTSAPVRNE